MARARHAYARGAKKLTLDGELAVNYGWDMTSVVNDGNQIEIPAEIANEFDIHPGTQLKWSRGADGSIHLNPVFDRGAAAREFMGSGRKWLKPGADPIGDLLRGRKADDELDQQDERL